MTSVDEHYASGNPLAAVTSVLDKVAPGGARLTVEQLSGFDHFHTAGGMATARLAELLAPGEGDTVLDAGCGLGGPARYLAEHFGCKVIGIDLTADFVMIGQLLNERTGFEDRVDLRVGDITDIQLDDACIDHVWSQHVAMNIADRDGLYRETRRVLKRGGRFALFDVIDGGGGELIIPVPWATRPEHSHLVSATTLRRSLEGAGFRIDTWDDPTEQMVSGMKAMMAAPPDPTQQFSPALFIDDIQTKGPNYLRNMDEGRTALALVVATAV